MSKKKAKKTAARPEEQAVAEQMVPEQPAAPRAAVSKAQPAAVTVQPLNRRDRIELGLFALLFFLSISVLSAKMSVVLAAVAALCCVGKLPSQHLRAAVGVPVVGMLAFLWMNGAAAIYAPFGALALSEFYKIVAAMSVAVIVLTRFERKHARGLLWIFGAMGAWLSLLSVDMVCGHYLYGTFNWLMNRLGMDYSGALDMSNYWRVNGPYNDGNINAAILGVTALIGIYLLLVESGKAKKFAAAVITSASTLGILLSGSRGGMLFFAVSCLVFLAVARGKRLPLFLVLCEAAVDTVLLGILMTNCLSRGMGAVALGLMLLCAVLLWAEELFISRMIQRVLMAHPKLAWGVMAGLVMVVLGYVVAALTVTGAYTFTSEGTMTYTLPDAPGSYTLSGSWNEDPVVTVYSQTVTERMRGEGTDLYNGPLSTAAYEVPESAVEVRITIYGTPGVTIDSLTVSDGTRIKLFYPLVPYVLEYRLHSKLLGGNSLTLRVQYAKDTWTLFTQSPLIGHGLASTQGLLRSVQPYHYETLFAHNHVLQILSDMGILGLAAYLLWAVGVAVLLLRRLRKEEDLLAAALFACWVMMNTHSLMEINFSIRAFQCFAFSLLVLPILLYQEESERNFLRRVAGREVKTLGLALLCLFLAYQVIFTGLLVSHNRAKKTAETLVTQDLDSFLSTMEGLVRQDVFDDDTYKISYLVYTATSEEPYYAEKAEQYAANLRKRGTFQTCNSLERYYYLPRGDLKNLFETSRESVNLAASDPDAWNYELNFYRTDVLEVITADRMEDYAEGVLALKSDLEAYNDSRIEPVELTEENTLFLEQVSALQKQGLLSEDGYLLLQAQNNG